MPGLWALVRLSCGRGYASRWEKGGVAGAHLGRVPLYEFVFEVRFWLMCNDLYDGQSRGF